MSLKKIKVDGIEYFLDVSSALSNNSLQRIIPKVGIGSVIRLNTSFRPLSLVTLVQLSSVSSAKVQAICITNGNRWSSAVDVENPTNITPNELTQIFGAEYKIAVSKLSLDDLVHGAKLDV